MIALFEDLESYLRSLQSPLTADYFLCQVTVEVFLGVVLLYLLISVVVIPCCVRIKEPIGFSALIFAYDIALVLVSAFYFVYGLKLSNYGELFLNFNYDFDTKRTNQQVLII